MNGRHFHGPADLANAIIAERQTADWEHTFFGDLSERGIGDLIQVAYYASQAANEGRFPRFTLLVPGKQEQGNLLVRLNEELTVGLLQRIGPTLASPDRALVVNEDVGSLRVVGIGPLRSLLTEMSFGDPAARPTFRPKGLLVEVCGPGDLRAGEHRIHRLHAGSIHQEISFTYDAWFREWYEEAAAELFDWMPGSLPSETGWMFPPTFAIVNAWLRLLRTASDLRHGGCFVIAPDPTGTPIRSSFLSLECSLGGTVAELAESVRQDRSTRTRHRTRTEYHDRLLLRDRLLSLIDAVAYLSTTDGCVLFNRTLELHSFGSMIEPENVDDSVPCFLRDSDERLDDVRIRSFGARRRSALQLCQTCPGAMAFVISQDGDLRIFVRRKKEVRLYENAVYW